MKSGLGLPTVIYEGMLQVGMSDSGEVEQRRKTIRRTHLDDIRKRRTQSQPQTQPQRSDLRIKPTLPLPPRPSEDDHQRENPRNQRQSPNRDPLVLRIRMHQGRIRDREQTAVPVDLVQSVEDGPYDDGQRPIEAVGFPEASASMVGHGGGVSVHEAQGAGGGGVGGIVGKRLTAVGFRREEGGWVGGMRGGPGWTGVGFRSEKGHCRGWWSGL